MSAVSQVLQTCHVPLIITVSLLPTLAATVLSFLVVFVPQQNFTRPTVVLHQNWSPGLAPLLNTAPGGGGVPVIWRSPLQT